MLTGKFTGGSHPQEEGVFSPTNRNGGGRVWPGGEELMDPSKELEGGTAEDFVVQYWEDERRTARGRKNMP